MKPINNIGYQIQYWTIFLALNLQESICKQVKKVYGMSAGDVVGFGDLSIDMFTEGPNTKHILVVEYCIYLWTSFVV